MNEAKQRAERLKKAAGRKDYYKILGVPRTADDRAIKKAYRKLALRWHPDKVGADEDRAHAERMFHDVAAAHEVLTNEELRRKFDNGEDPMEQGGGQQQGHPGNPFTFQFGGGGGFHFKFG